MTDQATAPEGYVRQCISEWSRARARIRRCADEARRAEAEWQAAIAYEQEAHRTMLNAANGRFQEEINSVE